MSKPEEGGKLPSKMALTIKATQIDSQRIIRGLEAEGKKVTKIASSDDDQALVTLEIRSTIYSRIREILNLD